MQNEYNVLSSSFSRNVENFRSYQWNNRKWEVKTLYNESAKKNNNQNTNNGLPIVNATLHISIKIEQPEPHQYYDTVAQ